ncbi:hypothetical protein, partial [Bacillus altitudinis]|uniref:hypothetical protein n=1 Tax=Bacillus altitudinis TaxID=293387 RepID=UPI001C92FFE1
MRRYLIEKKREEGRVEKWGEVVGEMGDDGCRMEGGCVDGEGERDEVKKGEFMVDKMGEEFDGMI